MSSAKRGEEASSRLARRRDVAERSLGPVLMRTSVVHALGIASRLGWTSALRESAAVVHELDAVAEATKADKGA